MKLWRDKFDGLPANEYDCFCGYKFLISQRVQHRALDCQKCGRYYFYNRQLNNEFTVEQIGRHKSDKARLARTLEYYDGLSS